MYSSPLSHLIETLVQTIELDPGALKERHVLRQTLHAIVRQAKAEQVAHMRADVRRMVGHDAMVAALAGQRLGQDSSS